MITTRAIQSQGDKESVVRQAQRYAAYLPSGVRLSEATKAQIAAAIRKGKQAEGKVSLRQPGSQVVKAAIEAARELVARNLNDQYEAGSRSSAYATQFLAQHAVSEGVITDPLQPGSQVVNVSNVPGAGWAQLRSGSAGQSVRSAVIWPDGTSHAPSCGSTGPNGCHGCSQMPLDAV